MTSCVSASDPVKQKYIFLYVCFLSLKQKSQALKASNRKKNKYVLILTLKWFQNKSIGDETKDILCRKNKSVKIYKGVNFTQMQQLTLK